MTMTFNEARGTWNVFNQDGEWYYEGTYEECSDIIERHSLSNEED